MCTLAIVRHFLHPSLRVLSLSGLLFQHIGLMATSGNSKANREGRVRQAGMSPIVSPGLPQLAMHTLSARVIRTLQAWALDTLTGFGS